MRALEKRGIFIRFVVGYRSDNQPPTAWRLALGRFQNAPELPGFCIYTAPMNNLCKRMVVLQNAVKLILPCLAQHAACLSALAGLKDWFLSVPAVVTIVEGFL